MRLEDVARIWKTSWEFAVPLRDAPFRFAHTSLFDKLRDLKRQTQQDAEKGQLDEDAKQRLQQLAAIETKFDENLKLLVNTGELLAIGFALPRTPESFPIDIPPDVWNSNIDWRNDAVSGNGLEFAAVRIAPFEDVEPRFERLQSSPTKVDAPRRGRPSSQEDVYKAYEALKQNGHINFLQSMRSQFPIIRAELCKLHPDWKSHIETMSDETIRQTISNDFKEMRRSKKQ